MTNSVKSLWNRVPDIKGYINKTKSSNNNHKMEINPTPTPMHDFIVEG